MQNLLRLRRAWSGISKAFPRTTRWLGRASGAVVIVIDAVLFPVSLLLDGCNRLIHQHLQGTEIQPPPGVLGTPLIPQPESWVDASRLDKLVEIGMRAFPASGLSHAARRDMYSRWLTANPSVIRYILLADGSLAVRRIGYSCILPMRKDSYFRYYRGELSEYSFSRNDIIRPSYLAPPRYLCLQAFAINDNKVSRGHWVALYQHLVMHMYVLMRGSTRILPKIIAEGETRSGKRVLAHRGFAQVGLSADGFPLFELDLSLPEGQMRKEAADTKHELLRLFALLSAHHNRLQATSAPFLPRSTGGLSC